MRSTATLPAASHRAACKLARRLDETGAGLRRTRADAFTGAVLLLRLDVEGDERRRTRCPEPAREMKTRFAETKKSNHRTGGVHPAGARAVDRSSVPRLSFVAVTSPVNITGGTGFFSR